MENSLPSEGKSFPSVPPPPDEELDAAKGLNPLERLASFRFTYVAVCVFIALYLFSVRALERSLDRDFQLRVAAAAVQIEPGGPHPAVQIRRNVEAVLDGSRWIRLGGVRVTALVLSADGTSVLYTDSQPDIPLPVGDGSHLLPALVDVVAAVPHNAVVSNAILVGYAGLLLTTLFLYTRTLARREEQRLAAARAARDDLASRAREIEHELRAVRGRLESVGPREEAHGDEIRALRRERTVLSEKLRELENREAALQADAVQGDGLLEEHQALEELLEEALTDLEGKDQEIQTLQRQIKKQDRGGKTARPGEQLARRLRTLYKNLEIEDRAIQDLVSLRDEAMQLKAEEQLKRLSDEPDHAAVRRKIGGLPPHLSIFELSFGGKGRLYYCKGRARRFRVLLVGAKNSQKPDLEYLSRLPKE